MNNKNLLTRSFKCLHTKIGIVQRILDEIARQLDNYEDCYGPTDRTKFDGDFFVPPELRNRITSSKGSLRIHSGLLTISRSRTFLSLSNNNRSSIHNSTPDLSRSMPNTPGSSHKLSLTSSYDSVLEENEEDGVIIITKMTEKNRKNKSKHVKQIFESSNHKNIQKRRNSEDFLESSRGSSHVSAIPVAQQHAFKSSDQAYRLIPRVKAPTNYLTETSDGSASTSNSNANVDRTKWGNVRGSNSFAAGMNISSLSTYTIPRISLGHSNKSKENLKILPNANFSEKQTSSTFIMHDNDDSIA